MHILTSNNQYGYKEGISTTDAVIKVEQYVGQAGNKEKVLLMDLPEAFGTINRTLLWTTLYKNGVPGEMIRHISRGHRGARHAPKYRGRYGEANENNIGFLQGSAISALLFIIYLGDMMEDLAALSRRTKFPIGIIQDRPHGQDKKILRGEVNKRRERHMKKYQKHAQLETPLWICRNKWKLGKRTKAEKDTGDWEMPTEMHEKEKEGRTMGWRNRSWETSR